MELGRVVVGVGVRGEAFAGGMGVEGGSGEGVEFIGCAHVEVGVVLFYGGGLRLVWGDTTSYLFALRKREMSLSGMLL